MTDKFEAALGRVEHCVGALGEALRVHSAEAVAAEAAELQRALAQVLELTSRHGTPVAPALRRRLALASGRFAAQRDSLARANAALGRAIDVLVPEAAARGGYAANGIAERRTRSGFARA